MNILLMPVAMLLTAAIRLVRPWCLVRVHNLTSERLGHFAGNTELYLCERDAGINVPQERYVDLWYHNWPISNRQLARMWERLLHVWPRWLLEPVDKMNVAIPGGKAHRIGHNASLDRDVHGLLERIPKHLSFLPFEEERGKVGLRELGILENEPFVCLCVRDSSYLKKELPWTDWSYHDYRNSNIQNYISAAEELAKRGYFVIRMGATVTESLNVSHPRIIDYAANGMRTDFMDIYLSANCSFFISTGTGIDSVAMAFRRPYVFVNYVPLEFVHTHSKNLLFIPKGHWLRAENRLMTFSEIFASGAGQFPYGKEYKDAGIELVENTAAEIAAVVTEMEERTTGNWRATAEDEVLQQRFWDIFPKSTGSSGSRILHGDIRGRIGADYLRRNKASLE